MLLTTGWVLTRSLAAPAAELLPNGLRIVVRERHTAPIVAIDFWVRAGSADEGPGENGCAHFLEHTLFKGTTNHSIGAADYAIENAGGVLNASTGADYAHYYTELPGNHVEPALAAIADIVRHATFPDAEIERERSVILDELATRETDPFDRIQKLLYQSAFGAQPYAHSPGGESASIKIRGRDSLVAFFKRLYVPGRCVLSLAGDITAAEGRKLAVHYFGDWAGAGTELNSDAPIPFPVQSSASDQQRPADPQAIGLAFAAPAAGSVRFTAIGLVTAALLGESGLSGRFSSQRWSGTHIATRYTPRRSVSLFTIVANVPVPIPARPFESPSPPQFADLSTLERTIRSEVSALAVNSPSQDALAGAIRAVQSQITYDGETTAGLAREVGLAELIGGDSPEELILRLGTITPAEVQAFASEWLSLAHCVTVRSEPGSAE